MEEFEFEAFEIFKYLESNVQANELSDREFYKRIVEGKKVIGTYNSIVWNITKNSQYDFSEHCFAWVRNLDFEEEIKEEIIGFGDEFLAKMCWKVKTGESP